MSRSILISLLFITSICLANDLAGLAQQAKQPTGETNNSIKIGAYLPLTGDLAIFGLSTKQGIELATDEQNQQGGLLGKQIEIIYQDDRGQQQEAAQCVTKLIKQDHVVAVIGEVASTNTIAGGSICQDYGVPMISSAATYPMLTKVGNNIFRSCFIDDRQGAAMAEFTIKDLKIHKVAIMHDNGSDYSVGLDKAFGDRFGQFGGTIVVDIGYQQTDTDFSEALEQLKKAKPQAIYLPGYYTQVGQIAAQARKMGINVPLLGGDGWDSPILFKIAKQAIDNSYFSNHFCDDDQNSRTQKFISNYRAKYNQAPDALAALAYDAAGMLFDAIKRAGKADSKLIRNALATTKNYNGVTGSITIGPDQEVIKPVMIIEIKKGKGRFRSKITPTVKKASAK